MNIEGLTDVLERMRDGRIRCIARDTTEPSALAHEVLTARPYAFLDDVPLEERRTHAVYTRRSLDVRSASDIAALDASAISRVRAEVWPAVRDADELHDALLTHGFLCEDEGRRDGDDASWPALLEELANDGRAGRLWLSETQALWVAAERLPELRAVHPEALVAPDLVAPERRRRDWERADALRELVRGRLELLGPTTTRELAAQIGVAVKEIDLALVALETEGFVLRGGFTSAEEGIEWCERRLLARIHRYTLDRLRSEIEPVSAADFMRFLFRWSRVEPQERASGPDGLSAVLELLDGYEVAAAAWEADVLAARLDEYDPLWLDGLCLSGRIAWGRLSPPASMSGRPFRSGPLRSSPISLFLREHAEAWLALAPAAGEVELSTEAAGILTVLARRGALFFAELVRESDLLPTRVEAALGELVAVGLASADSFAGLRALLIPSSRRRPMGGRTRRRRGRVAPFGVESAGRWSIFREPHLDEGVDSGPVTSAAWNDPDAEAVEEQAWVLLRRYGVVFRKLLARETNLAPWRELVRVYRRLEARGDIRGGRFVAGFSGEQFALPEAVGLLRSTRREARGGRLLSVSAADPLNLSGVVTPGMRITALAGNRVLYRDGVPVAAQESGKTRLLAPIEGAGEREVEAALTGPPVPPQLRVYLGQR
jgi:ATP-dependent Lhr-like helicase